MVNAHILVGAIVLVVVVALIDSYRVYQLGKEVLRLGRLVAELQEAVESCKASSTPVSVVAIPPPTSNREESIVNAVETLIIEEKEGPSPSPEIVPAEEEE